MKAMVLKKIIRLEDNIEPLVFEEIENPIPEFNEIVVKVSVSGVCHTEIEEIEGRLKPSFFPIILGHQIVGTVVEKGAKSNRFNIGDRVGIAWINSSCLSCKYCKSNLENLCENFKSTGKDCNGGYAEYTKVSEEFAYKIPVNLSDVETAPLLCAGSIGYRSLKLTGIKDGDRIGLMGFGSSGHLVIKLIKNIFPNSKVYVFSRNERERNFAMKLGAVWSGDIDDYSPEKLSSIIDTTPVWKPVVESLKNLEPGGRLVVNAIRKEDIDKSYLQNIIYESDLWMEKEIKSVANVSRKDVHEFLNLVEKLNIKPEIQTYNLKLANKAIQDLKNGSGVGSKVLIVS